MSEFLATIPACLFPVVGGLIGATLGVAITLRSPGRDLFPVGAGLLTLVLLMKFLSGRPRITGNRIEDGLVAFVFMTGLAIWGIAVYRRFDADRRTW